MARGIFSLRKVWCVFTLLFIGIAFYVTIFTPIHIDTDLRKISPELQFNQSIRNFVDRFSNQSQKKIMIALRGGEIDIIEDAVFKLEEELEKSDTLKLYDPIVPLEEFLSLIRQHRFELIADQDRSRLQSANSQEITELANFRLYDPDAPVRLIPVSQDPLSLANQYLFDIVSRIPGAQDNNSTQGVVKVIEVEGDVLDLNYQSRIDSDLGEIITTISDEYPELELLKTGVFVFANQAAKESKSDIQFISTSSMVGVSLIIVGFFFSLRPLIFCILTVFTALLSGFVISFAIFPRVHILTLVFGASLIGVVVDYALHYYYFYQGKPVSSQRGSALTKALFFSCATSAIGYAALSVSDLVALKQVALFSVAGLLGACFFVVTWGSWFHRQGTVSNNAAEHIINAILSSRILWQSIVAKRLLVGSLVIPLLLLIVGAVVQPMVTLDNPRVIFKPDATLMNDEQIISSMHVDFEPASFLVIDARTEAELFDQINGFQAQANNIKLFGVQTFFPSPSVRRENYLLQMKLYEGDAPAQKFLENLGVGDDKIAELKSEFRRSVKSPLSSAKVFQHSTHLPALVSYDDDLGWQSIQLIEKGQDISAIKKAVAQFDQVQFVDLVADTAENLNGLRVRASWLLVLSFIAVTMLLILRYRRVSVLFMMIVPLSSVFWFLAMFSFLQLPVTLFHIMALFLVLGLGMDYVIFARDLSAKPAHTLTAITLSAATSLLSFGLLSVSSFPLVSAFGITVLVGNTVNLLATYLYVAAIHNKTIRGRPSYG